MTAPAIVAIVHESERKLNWKGLCEAVNSNNLNENKAIFETGFITAVRDWFAKPVIKS